MNRSQTAKHAAELRKQAAELIRRAEVEEHYAKGGEVQVSDGKYGWLTMGDPQWDWEEGSDYRPKPELAQTWIFQADSGIRYFAVDEQHARRMADVMCGRAILLREVEQP